MKTKNYLDTRLKIFTRVIYPLLLFFVSGNLLGQEENIRNIYVTDFGAIPNDTINDRLQIQKAIDYCKNKNLSELYFPQGVYVLEHPDAIKLMDDVMSGKMGQNPEKIIFTPYYKYIKGLDISNTHNLTLVGNGAELICNGWMEPISIENSKNIKIEGFTIDYKRQPHSECEIIEVNNDSFDILFSNEYALKNNIVAPRIMFYDPFENRLENETVYFPIKRELIDANILRIWAKIPKDYKNSFALINHSFHFRPAILIHESSETIIKNVTIHSQPGMGVVGHRSHNILMDGLRVVPRPGKYQSTNTDATHFTSNTGYIRFKNCMFQGQGDDTTNVHNYYYTITGFLNNKYITTVNAPTGTHAQVLDYPNAGDIFELLDKSSLKVKDSLVVNSFETFPDKWETHIEFTTNLPKNINDFLLINVTRLPNLQMQGCTILSHLARGILVKTRNVLIENNTIIETTGTGIHIGAEGAWHEGPGSSEVIVRNNRILRCGTGDGTQNQTSGIVVNVVSENPSKKGVHKNLTFENNIIEAENSKYGIYVTGASNVSIKHNQISGCEIPVYYEK